MDPVPTGHDDGLPLEIDLPDHVVDSSIGAGVDTSTMVRKED